MKSFYKSVFRGVLFMAILTSVSCAKPLPPIDSKAPTGDEELVPMVFSAVEHGKPSKVTGVSESNETRINRWVVFAFDDESGWVAYGVRRLHLFR